MKVGIIALGCSKNLVDSEAIVGFFVKNGFTLTTEVSEADAVVVNTCGFLTEAVQEALEIIFSLKKDLKDDAKLIITGCMVERFANELTPEALDAHCIVLIRDYHQFGQKLSSLLPVKPGGLSFMDRVVSDNNHAYIKISEGCNNRCAYCAIPLIRGNFVSRPSEQIMEEARMLMEKGVKELTIVSQDTTRYGTDNGDISLAKLLLRLVTLPNLFCLRVLYLYPTEVSDELIEVIAENKVIAPYFDIPVQHVSNNVLSLMRRRGDLVTYRKLIKKIRARIPDAIIRTTLIVGFPGETQEDFEQLCDFVKTMRFDRLGVFCFSREKGTPAYSLKNQVPKKIKLKRQQEIMLIQEKIAESQNRRFLKTEVQGIVTHIEDEYCYVRAFMFAPDDIDGMIIALADNVKIGDIVTIKLTHCLVHDLYGKIVQPVLNH